MARRIIPFLVGLLFATAHAEVPRDPTRPPSALGEAAETTPAGPTLQAIRLSGTTRSAVISGQEVRLGDRVGELRVVRIDEDRVTLRDASGTTVLKLFPSVEKISREPAPPAPKKKPRATTETRKEKP